MERVLPAILSSVEHRALDRRRCRPWRGARALVENHYGSIPNGKVDWTRALGNRMNRRTSILRFVTPELAGDIQQATETQSRPAHAGAAARRYAAARPVWRRAGFGSRLAVLSRRARAAARVVDRRVRDYTPGELGVFVVHATARPERRAKRRARRVGSAARARDGESHRRSKSSARVACSRRSGCAASSRWKARRIISRPGSSKATGNSAGRISIGC